MKIIGFLIASICSFNYFPLKDGMTWEYRTDEANMIVWVESDKTDLDKHYRWFGQKNEQGDIQILTCDTLLHLKDGVYVLNFGKPELFLPKRIALGDTLGYLEERYVVTSFLDQVTIMNQCYKDVIEVETISGEISLKGMFARNIGMIYAETVDLQRIELMTFKKERENKK